MRGCVRSCSRRQRRPQHHPEPSAGPAIACPAAAVSVPATVSPKQLPLHGQVNLCGRLLLLCFQLLLLLPLPSRSRAPLTPLTLAQLYTVSSAQLSLALRALPRHWTHRLFYFLRSCIAPPSASRVSCRPEASSWSCALVPLLGSGVPPTPHSPAPSPGRSGQTMLKMLSFKLLLLAVALGFFEGDAKFGERSEGSGARRRRCLNGNPPKRLKRRDRRMMSQLELLSGGEMLCSGFYPRLSCCLRSDSPGLGRLDHKIFSVTNNTECGKLLEEIKCALCSPHSQSLFHSPEREALDRDLVLPLLCKDYCKEFFYTCRGHIPGFLQTTAEEFCFYYAGKDGALCFPDFPRKQIRGPASNSLDQMEEYDKVEEISRKHKHNCFCVQEVVSGLRQPVSALHSGDGSGRLFILEREGYVKILTPEGEMLKEPYLDIHKLVQSGIKGGDERGLLNLAFHPNYKRNGKLYVSYTTNQERWAMGPHDHILRVVEYTVSRKNPHQVDPRTARVFLEVAELHRKHLGGQLLFGPDGFLYIILGDGMITLDDMEEMDGLSDFTGSVLRLDVDTDLCNVPYSIPRSNPHFNSTNQPPEVFAHGLHNPGRCAVDRHPTDININLTILCSDSNGKNRSSARILQIIKGKDYESEPSLLEFKPFSSGPLVGGFVYRGCQSERLYGSYVFGDRDGNFLTLQQSPMSKQWQEKPLCLGNGGPCRGYFAGHILGFGEDESGEVYILSSSKSMTQAHNGKLYKIVDPKRPLVPEECRAVMQPAQMLASECSRLCRNGYCTPTGTCCCSPGWEGDFCRIAKCEPACRHGGVCVRPNKCLCKKGYLGPQCEQVDRNIRRVTRAGILDQIIDMTSYLLDLTSYIV
ncbi:hedgehog-interacting protein [Molossus molossus]|uniref:Hedgehog-interacting protein n=1 Tax=Molossus molossus TaxID=27622 RepID=A0A7J8I7Y9_MOLMO|nr:hedgehog-interacting protein [Molossus molossus]KAF6480275.1 hedgehog interacting protein [Molossus molossus]